MTKERIARYNIYKRDPAGNLVPGAYCIICAKFFPLGKAAIRYHFKNSKMHWIRKKLIPLTKFLK